MRVHLWAFVVLIMNHWVVYILVILKLAFLVGSDAVWFGRLIPTFWGNLLLSLFNCNRPIFYSGFNEWYQQHSQGFFPESLWMLPVLLLLPCLDSCPCTRRMEAGGYSHLPHSAGWCSGIAVHILVWALVNLSDLMVFFSFYSLWPVPYHS